MAHMKYVSRQLPEKALSLPADHTCQFILDNLPDTFLDLVRLILHHVKGTTDDAV